MPKRVLAALLALAAPVQALAAPRRLVLFGGGDHSKGALKRFVAWAGRDKARVLAVTWADDEPDAYFRELQSGLRACAPVYLERAPTAETIARKKDRFLAQLGRATGVFFTGGDQNRIAKVLRENPDLLKALRARYREGAVFAGASAGAAAMSELMITGEGDFSVLDGARVGTDEGLGLWPKAVIDQHFIVRMRENRLFALVLDHPRLVGVGIDKNGALMVENELFAEAAGPGKTMLVRAGAAAGRLLVDLLKDGQRADLGAR